MIILILQLNSILATAQLQQSVNWTGPNNNSPLNWNYSPQETINQSNVGSLQVEWTFPVPSAPPIYQGAEGAMITPLVIDGIVYTITNWHRVFALDAANGNVLWFRDLPLILNYSGYLQASIPAGVGYNTGALGHYHSMLYTNEIANQPLVWVVSNTYQIFALNALNGDIVINFQPFPTSLANISGNYGIYDEDTPMILIDQERGMLIFSPSVSEGTSAGRGFLRAFNISTTQPEFMWQTFLMPPQDGSDPTWSLSSVQNSTNAYIFNGTAAINLKTLPSSELKSVLFNDWGNFGYNGTVSYAGMSAGWGGSWAIDENSGVAFVGTSQASPDWNATNRPGPNLWSDSILSINETTGRIIWGFQTEAHSLGDLDCSWNVLLANVTINSHNQEVVYKGCKDGYLFALNADNGSMIWYLKPQSIKWSGVTILNPLNSTQMTNYSWYGFPSTKPIVLNPSDTGSLESDIAYDPKLNLIFLAPYNMPKEFQITDVGPGVSSLYDWEFDWGTNFISLLPIGPANTTIYAVDASTGSVQWTFLIPDQPYRGGLTVSGGVVYVSTLDGTLRMLNEQDGRLISQKTIGGELLIQPSIGEDSNGTTELFLTDMGSARWGPTFPGFIQALGVTSNTTTISTTITSVVNESSAKANASLQSPEFYTVAAVAIFFAITSVSLWIRLKRVSRKR